MRPFSYCSSNPAIAKVVILNLFAYFFRISFGYLFIASILYYFPYSYRSSNCCSFTLLKAFAKINSNLLLLPIRARKSDNYRYRYSWKSDNFKKKQRTDIKKAANRIKSDNFTRSNNEESKIAIAILEKLMI